MFRLQQIQRIEDNEPNRFSADINYDFDVESFEDAIYHIKRFFVACGYAQATLDRYLGDEE